MAFEKMTTPELFNKFIALFPTYIDDGGCGHRVVKNYCKVGARALRLQMSDNSVLFFLWYDNSNWNLGTKMYRNRPKKQIYIQVRKDLANGKGMLRALEKVYGVADMRPSDSNTNGNDVITSCNHNDPPGAVGADGLEPIDWVKEDPDIPGEGTNGLSYTI